MRWFGGISRSCIYCKPSLDIRRMISVTIRTDSRRTESLEIHDSASASTLFAIPAPPHCFEIAEKMVFGRNR